MIFNNIICDFYMNNIRFSKIIFKVIFIFLIIFLIFNINMMRSFCTDSTGRSAISSFQDNANNEKVQNTTQNFIGPIINIVQIVAVGIAIIMLIILGMKYMYSSIEDKAEIKKHAVIYVVGAIVMFSAAGIIEIIKEFTGNIKYE